MIILLKKGVVMDTKVNILNLYQKIICSLLCIVKNTNNENLKSKSYDYLEDFILQYELYNNKGLCSLNHYEDIIDFCNECYEDKDVFDFAEDVEYGLKELNEINIGNEKI